MTGYFLGVLDSLGEIIHFPDLLWQEAYVLNPRWLTYGVYSLLYSDIVVRQQGILSHADVITILCSTELEDEYGNKLMYPKKTCRFIIDAMSKFKLCYRMLDDEKRFVIPDILPLKQPDNLTDYFKNTAEGTVAFEFNFKGMLPRNIMPNLIVAHHKEIIKDDTNKQLVWKQGVLINYQNHQALALIQMDYSKQTLQLWVQGEETREYLVVLRNNIYAILDDIKWLSVEENVILPAFALVNKNFHFSNIEKSTYKSLLEEAKIGREITFSNAGIQYYLEKIMGFILTEERRREEGVGQKSIINITHGEAYFGSQSTGNHNNVSTKIMLELPDQQHIMELQDYLTTLMEHIENHDVDFKIKHNAYNELQQIDEYLGNLEDATPQIKRKLHQLLTSIKDGSLEALQLAKEIKESEETVNWLVEKAAVVSALITVLPG